MATKREDDITNETTEGWHVMFRGQQDILLKQLQAIAAGLKPGATQVLDLEIQLKPTYAEFEGLDYNHERITEILALNITREELYEILITRKLKDMLEQKGIIPWESRVRRLRGQLMRDETLGDIERDLNAVSGAMMNHFLEVFPYDYGSDDED